MKSLTMRAGGILCFEKKEVMYSYRLFGFSGCFYPKSLNREVVITYIRGTDVVYLLEYIVLYRLRYIILQLPMSI